MNMNMEQTSISFSAGSINLYNRWKSLSSCSMRKAGEKYNYFVTNRGVSSKRVRLTMSKKSNDVSFVLTSSIAMQTPKLE